MPLRSTEPPSDHETNHEWQPPEGFYQAYCAFWNDSLAEARKLFSDDPHNIKEVREAVLAPKPEAEILAMLRALPEENRASSVRRFMGGWEMAKLTSIQGKISSSVIAINKRLREQAGE